MIAITGATGQLGRLVIEALIQHVPAAEIIAAVRSPAKASDLADRGIVVREADYSRPVTLNAAFQGTDKVLLISSNALGERVPQHQAVIDAAKAAGVKLLAYTSLLNADSSSLKLGEEHRATESALKASGVPYVILRNGWYTENYALGIASALAQGSFIGSAGEGRIASASRLDYARAAAAVLLAQDVAGNTYELAGDSAYTLTEFAAEIALQSGKAVNYVNLPQADFAAVLKKAGLPDDLADLVADSDISAAQNSLFDQSHTLSRLIGQPATPWQETIKQFIAAS